MDEDDIETDPDDMEYQECQDPGIPGIPGIPNIPETPGTPGIIETSRPGLPDPLEPTGSGSMTVVSREYFPDAEFVFPGIYILPGDSGYVLFCVDNGRYSNSWDHSCGVTTLKWVTASKDNSRSALRAISDSTNVYVFRKISGESKFRYMGKVFKSENVNRMMGTVDLCVC